MNLKPKMIALCEEPRVMRALVSSTQNWVTAYQAETVEQLHRLLENHEQATVVVTQLILRNAAGNEILSDLRRRYPRNRFALLASYADLSRVIEVIHNGLIDSLIHVPLSKGQFLNAISGPAPVSLAVAASETMMQSRAA